MKRIAVLLLSFCLLLSGCSLGNRDGDTVYNDPKRGFTFSFPNSMTAEVNDDVVTVYIKKAGEVPYVSLCFTALKDNMTFDLSEYLDHVAETLDDSYAEDLTQTLEMHHKAGGKTLFGISCEFTAQVDGAHRWYLVDEIDAYVVKYECAFDEGDEDLAADALEEIVGTLRSAAGGNTAKEPQVDDAAPQTTPTAPSKLGAYSVTKNAPLQLQTSRYDGGFFSLDLPAGWVIETTGEYITFGFHAYDPQNPERQIFFYGKMEPFLKSMEAQQKYQDSADLVGANDAYGYQMSADAPVLLTPSTDYFFVLFNSYNSYIKKYGVNHQLPVMDDISILEQYADSTPTAFNTLDNSIVRASFYSQNNVECQGLMAAQVTDKISITNVYPGIDMGFYTVYNCNGVIAPAGEFNELREQLTACLASFNFTEEYVRQAQQSAAEETSAILAMSRQMQASYDSYNAAWSARQTSYDIISQKNSDATLGYDRLYDPDTGEIYRAELGFYDSYDANRAEYSNSNLQLIDESAEHYYLDGVDYYITN